jgi:hypothetical protein
MTKEQLDIFKKAFLNANNGQIGFPDNFHLDKVNEIEFYTEGMRCGYKVRFLVKKNENSNWYLDLFGSDDYHSWHKRIDNNGNIYNLEMYKGEYGRVIYPEDPERTEREHKEIQLNNNLVHSLLVEKGLERNFENPEFEKENVIRLTDYKWK